MADTLFPKSIPYIDKNKVEETTAFRTVCYQRWADAVASYQQGRYLVSVYLAGYSLECILKYTILESKFSGKKDLVFSEIAKELDDNIGAFKRAHRLDLLVQTGNYHKIFSQPNNKETSVKVLTSWKSEWRYSQEEISAEQAAYFLDLVREFFNSLIESTNPRLRIKELQPFEREGE